MHYNITTLVADTISFTDSTFILKFLSFSTTRWQLTTSSSQVPVPPVTLSSLTHSVSDLSSPSLEEFIPQEKYLESRQHSTPQPEASPPPTLLQRCSNNRSPSRRSSSVSDCSAESDVSLRGYHSDTEILSAGETGFKERSKTFHTLDDKRSRSKFIFLL